MTADQAVKIGGSLRMMRAATEGISATVRSASPLRASIHVRRLHIGPMPRPSKKAVAAAKTALAKSLAERNQTHSPRRVRLQILGMLDAHNDGTIWAAWLMGSLAGIVLKQIDILVAVNGALLLMVFGALGLPTGSASIGSCSLYHRSRA